VSVFIKICGLNTLRAVRAAAEAGADAAGFVFAPSPRRVTFEQARSLASELPDHVLRIAVFARVRPEEIDAACDEFEPDVIQADAATLRDLVLPPGVQALPVVRDGEDWRGDAEWILCEGRASGTGERADWRAAAALAQRLPVVLAGGLDAGNVAAAIAEVRPFGVDVSSGVEASRGVKDAQMMREFVAAVREAERLAEETWA
jgi:phosphoribosylanthranilate isomerase